jgi:hypothetical protein
MAADSPGILMFRCAIAGLIGFLAAGSATAQQSPAAAEAPAASSPAPAAKPVTPMEEPLPGDHWTYEVRDEITGAISATRMNVVTEVTPTEISIRFSIQGTTNGGFNIYDRSWNLISNEPWRYSPNDGSGIRTPLAIGKTWTFQSSDVNAGNGNIGKRSGTSKVVGQESLTTRAGTFETFKIETSYSVRGVKDPTRKAEVTAQTWYAPAIDHWVKRTFVSRTDKHLRVNNTLELVEYGRKQ